jgi:hypothetical protein
MTTNRSGISGAIKMGAKEAAAKSVGASIFPGSGKPVELSQLELPRFIITIDTEEEFDWTGPFSRDAHGLTHLTQIARFQALCEKRHIKPVYLVDYPVAADGFGSEYFGDLAKRGVAEIGLQLHPWVTPPFDEVVNPANSYACNLARDLERAKLFSLYDIVARRIGVHAVSYRAGRYGAGPNTPDLLIELGIKVDTSVRSHFDYSAQGGPNYARHPLMPYWVADDELLELPLTTMFGGAAKKSAPVLFDRAFRSETMRALLARGGLVERIALTPEGIPAHKAIDAINLALSARLPVLVFSFHSPSLAPGHTPYVRDARDLELFYHWWEQVFDHLEKRKVQPATISEIAAAAFA